MSNVLENNARPHSSSFPIRYYTKSMTTSDSRMIILSKQEAGKIIDQQRQLLKLSWSSLAEAINKPKVWATAALLGQHALSEDDAVTITSLLQLDDDLTRPIIRALQQIPHRGQAQIPADPTIYRFYEALGVYGEALKALIHEEFGDGIMSAINFGIDIAKKDDPSGARVVVTFNGKFLDYHWPAE